MTVQPIIRLVCWLILHSINGPSIVFLAGALGSQRSINKHLEIGAMIKIPPFPLNQQVLVERGKSLFLLALFFKDKRY